MYKRQFQTPVCAGGILFTLFFGIAFPQALVAEVVAGSVRLSYVLF